MIKSSLRLPAELNFFQEFKTSLLLNELFKSHQPFYKNYRFGNILVGKRNHEFSSCTQQS